MKNISYELAKKLKDAGFNHCLKWGKHPAILEEVQEGDVPLPTLEELIKACGEDFNFLAKKNGVFVACSFHKSDKDGNISSQECLGASPIEAVARLWLALNKK